jgi:glycosyltransferase involved in cell wall biosynthesis
VWLYCRLTGAGFVVDAHTGAFLDPRWKRLLFIHRFFSRRALATLITNRHLQEAVEAWGAPTVTVADVPVKFAPPSAVALGDGPNLTLVSSFDRDEPVEAFIEAARAVPDVTFHVTGDQSAGRRRAGDQAPPNVRFTGFLPAGEYVGLLLASDAVMSLTTLEHTMQRGAYEAVYLERPVIVSSTALLRSAFAPGGVHVDNTPPDIVRGIREMLANLGGYREEVRTLKHKKLDAWAHARARMQAILDR